MTCKCYNKGFKAGEEFMKLKISSLCDEKIASGSPERFFTTTPLKNDSGASESELYVRPPYENY